MANTNTNDRDGGLTPEQRQDCIDIIERYIGTLSSMPWNKVSDEDLLKLESFILGTIQD